MAPFLLDAIVVVELLCLALGCAFFAFWKRSAERPRWWLIAFAVILGYLALVVLPFLFLTRIKGEGDGLYALGLVPLAALLAGPSLVAVISGFALFKTDRREHRR